MMPFLVCQCCKIWRRSDELSRGREEDHCLWHLLANVEEADADEHVHLQVLKLMTTGVCVTEVVMMLVVVVVDCRQSFDDS